LAEKTIRGAREGLIHLVETGGFSGSLRNQVTIVFDGQAGVVSPKKTSGVKVVFSSGETADDLIKRLVGNTENKKSVYVVTDDKALGQSVKGLGAKVLSVKDFFGKPQEKISKALKVKKISEEKDISMVMEFKINDELKKAWLK
jgi:predicted RNA-binding protein with PIN domain